MDLNLNLRCWRLDRDAGGHAMWRIETLQKRVPATRTAILICDMWDAHWSRGATERVDAMAPEMDRVIGSARARGVHIIHAPSDTLAAYTGTPARERTLAAPATAPPEPIQHVDPPLPIDDSDEGSDTGEHHPTRAWSRQHPAIKIDHGCDTISDDGAEVYNLLRLWNIEQLLIMGVHTNMCVLNRSFGIKQMVRWQIPVALARDLTDAMYNPARAPYVSHDAGHTACYWLH